MSSKTLTCQVEWILPKIDFRIILVEIVKEIDEMAGCFSRSTHLLRTVIIGKT